MPEPQASGRLVLVMGAGSGIGRALARALAARGDTLVLAGRDTRALADDAADLRLRHRVDVTVVALDVLQDPPGTAFAGAQADPPRAPSAPGTAPVAEGFDAAPVPGASSIAAVPGAPPAAAVPGTTPPAPVPGDHATAPVPGDPCTAPVPGDHATAPVPGDQPVLDRTLPRLPDVVICCVGTLPEEPLSAEPEAIRHALRSNGEGPIVALAPLVAAMRARGCGSVVGIASVAGLRGRASNGLYGAGKAAFIAWLSAERNRCHGTGVQVMTVLPGFVATRMTRGMTLPPALTATPEEVAGAILRGIEQQRDVIYVRPLWRWIMAAITHLPERLFRRLRL